MFIYFQKYFNVPIKKAEQRLKSILAVYFNIDSRRMPEIRGIEYLE
jgi:hypothetical protein